MYDPCEKFASLVYGSRYPFEKNCLPCTRVKSSVQKKLQAVHTDQVIPSKKIACRAHGSSQPFKKKLSSVQSARAIPAKTVCQPFTSKDFSNEYSLLFMIIIIGLVQIASGVYKHRCEWSRFICHFSAISITIHIFIQD